MNIILAATQHGHEEGVWQSYLDLVTDPAHLMLEATLIILIDVILVGLCWPLIKRAIKRHDREVHGHGTEATGMEEW